MAKISVSDDPLDEVLGGEPAKRITKKEPRALAAVPEPAPEEEAESGADGAAGADQEPAADPPKPADKETTTGGGTSSRRRSRSSGNASPAAALDLAGEQRLMSSRHPESVVTGLEQLVYELKQKNRRITKQDVLTAILAQVSTLSKAERDAIGERALEVRTARESRPL